MIRRTYRVLALLVCMAVCCGSLLAQTGKAITIRMLDGKTGKLITASGFQVRINHEQTLHSNWVVQNEDGTAKLTVPDNAALISIQGTYDSSMLVYSNCDSVTAKESPVDHWYEVSEILASGVVAHNGCEKPTATAKLKLFARPGEFIFFVRKLNWREKIKEDYSSSR